MPAPGDRVVVFKTHTQDFTYGLATTAPSGGGGTGLALPLVFSMPGAIITPLASPRWYGDGVTTYTFTKIRLSVATTSTATLGVGVYVSGSLMHTISLAAGSYTQLDTFTITCGPTDYLMINVSSAGADAKDATLELYA